MTLYRAGSHVAMSVYTAAICCKLSLIRVIEYNNGQCQGAYSLQQWFPKFLEGVPGGPQLNDSLELNGPL